MHAWYVNIACNGIRQELPGIPKPFSIPFLNGAKKKKKSLKCVYSLVLKHKESTHRNESGSKHCEGIEYLNAIQDFWML